MRTVHIAVYDGLADWEIGYVTAAVHGRPWHQRPGSFAVQTVAVDPSAVRTMGGLRVLPDLMLSELASDESAMLVLPGSPAWDAGTLDGAAWADAARCFLDDGVPVAAICGATRGLAEHGLLDVRRHTSAAVDYLKLAEAYRGAAAYCEADAVNDDGLITAGPAHPVAFAREILAELGAFAPEVLDAWCGLYRTGDPRYFEELMRAPATA